MSMISLYLHDVTGIRVGAPRLLASGAWSRDVVFTNGDTRLEVTVFADSVESIGYVDEQQDEPK
jgi:hypothetical protein